LPTGADLEQLTASGLDGRSVGFDSLPKIRRAVLLDLQLQGVVRQKRQAREVAIPLPMAVRIGNPTGEDANE